MIPRPLPILLLAGVFSLSCQTPNQNLAARTAQEPGESDEPVDESTADPDGMEPEAIAGLDDAPAYRLSFGGLTVQPDASEPQKQGIDRVYQDHHAELLGCYLATVGAFEGDEVPWGKLFVDVHLSEDGSVRDAVMSGTTMAAPDVEHCVLEAMKSWRFVPQGKKKVVVKRMLLFSPAG